MRSIINLNGLNEQQKWLARQLWLCESLEEIAELRDSLDEDMYHDIHLVMELIFLADMDNFVIDEKDCKDAARIIERIQDELDA